MVQGIPTRQERRAMAWLSRHGGGRDGLTPLLVARLAARQRGLVISYIVGAVPLVGFSVWLHGLDWQPGARLVGGYALFGVAVCLAAVLGLWVQRRANRGVGAALPQRVARPAAVPVRAVLGRATVVATAVIFGGGLLVGAVGLATATDSTGRLTYAVFSCAVLVFAALTVVVLTEVVRRPTIADDPLSLVYDDVLRREDVTNGPWPFPLLLAVLAAIDGAGGTAAVNMYLSSGYALLGIAVFFVAKYGAHFAPVSPARPTAGPAPEQATR